MKVIEEVVYNSITSPSSGNLNLFNIRLKDENNVWGPVYKKVIASSNIVRDIKIQQAEYFWGTGDPGEEAEHLLAPLTVILMKRLKRSLQTD